LGGARCSREGEQREVREKHGYLAWRRCFRQDRPAMGAVRWEEREETEPHFARTGREGDAYLAAGGLGVVIGGGQGNRETIVRIKNKPATSGSQGRDGMPLSPSRACGPTLGGSEIGEGGRPSLEASVCEPGLRSCLVHAIAIGCGATGLGFLLHWQPTAGATARTIPGA
jgi:hypothetical protein